LRLQRLAAFPALLWSSAVLPNVYALPTAVVKFHVPRLIFEETKLEIFKNQTDSVKFSVSVLKMRQFHLS
jgi:hypothetical protein